MNTRDLVLSLQGHNLSKQSDKLTPKPSTITPKKAVIDEFCELYKIDNYQDRYGLALEARRIYELVRYSAVNEPAFLYKLRNSERVGCEADASRYFKQGRLFGARNSLAGWETNVTWMLGHIHKGNEFLMISSLTPENIFTPPGSQRYSAFAREIAVAFKANYKVTKIEYVSAFLHEQVYLSPTQPLEQALQTKLQDIQVNDVDCKNAIQQVVEQKNKLVPLAFRQPSPLTSHSIMIPKTEQLAMNLLKKVKDIFIKFENSKDAHEGFVNCYLILI